MCLILKIILGGDEEYLWSELPSTDQNRIEIYLKPHPVNNTLEGNHS